MGNNNSAQDDKTDKPKPNPKATTNVNANARANAAYGRTGIDPMLQWEIDRLNNKINGYESFNSDGLNMPYMTGDAFNAARSRLPNEARNPYYDLKHEYPHPGCPLGRNQQSSYSRNWNADSMFEPQGPKGTSNGSEQCSYKIGTSDNLRYVELIVCKDDQQKFVEKYKVHNKKPNHQCGPNCPICILLSSEHNSPTSERASDIPAYYGMLGGAANPTYSTTSDDFGSNYTHSDLFSTTSDNESLDMAEMRRNLLPTDVSQYGGADAGTDDEAMETDLEDRELDEIDQAQMKNRGWVPDNRDSYASDDTETTDDSDASNDLEINTDDSEDVGDIDVETDTETETGGVGTSEQRRVVGSRFKIFQSLTPSDAYDAYGRDDDDIYDSDDDTIDSYEDATSDGYGSVTEQVNAAMERVKYTRASKNAYKSGPFDSEDRAILGLHTDSDSYMNRPVKLNQKYN